MKQTIDPSLYHRIWTVVTISSGGQGAQSMAGLQSTRQDVHPQDRLVPMSQLPEGTKITSTVYLTDDDAYTAEPDGDGGWVFDEESSRWEN